MLECHCGKPECPVGQIVEATQGGDADEVRRIFEQIGRSVPEWINDYELLESMRTYDSTSARRLIEALLQGSGFGMDFGPGMEIHNNPSNSLHGAGMGLGLGRHSMSGSLRDLLSLMPGMGSQMSLPGGRSMPFGMSDEFEEIMVIAGEDGTARTITTGSRLEPVDLSTIPAEIITGLKEAGKFGIAIREKLEVIVHLRQEVQKQSPEVRRERITLKHAVWNAIGNADDATDDAVRAETYYGGDGLSLGIDQDVVYLVDNGERVEGITVKDGAALMERQTAIDAKETTISNMETDIARLELEVKHEPELRDVMQKEAAVQLFEHLEAKNPKLARQILTRQANIYLDEDGQISIVVRQDFREESDELPPHIRQMLGLMVEGDGSKRRKKWPMLNPLRRVLGIPIYEAPKIAETPPVESDADTTVEPAADEAPAKAAGTPGGNGHDVAAQVAAATESDTEGPKREAEQPAGAADTAKTPRT